MRTTIVQERSMRVVLSFEYKSTLKRVYFCTSPDGGYVYSYGWHAALWDFFSGFSNEFTHPVHCDREENLPDIVRGLYKKAKKKGVFE